MLRPKVHCDSVGLAAGAGARSPRRPPSHGWLRTCLRRVSSGEGDHSSAASRAGQSQKSPTTRRSQHSQRRAKGNAPRPAKPPRWRNRRAPIAALL